MLTRRDEDAQLLLTAILNELVAIRSALAPEPAPTVAPPECPYCHTSDFLTIMPFGEDEPRHMCRHCGAQFKGDDL